MKTLNQNLNEIYEKEGTTLGSEQVIIARQDGVIVFTNRSGNDSEAALIGGVWQAAFQLKEMSSLMGDEEIFRLSFDSSDKGIFIKSFSINEQSFFASIIYKDVLNPGRLKNEFSNFVAKVSENVKTLKLATNKTNKEKTKFLFQQISDREIDEAFSFLRG